MIPAAAIAGGALLRGLYAAAGIEEKRRLAS
jgi:hypothetical protein